MRNLYRRMPRIIALAALLIFGTVGVVRGSEFALANLDGSELLNSVETSTSASLVAAADTVYVTRTGAKYHRASCRYLSRSKIPMALVSAAEGYSACKVCRPPTPSSAQSAVQSAASASSRSASGGRCQAITKKGSQCKRSAQGDRSYCWQH